MILDFHTHYYPDKIAERAMASVAHLSEVSVCTDGTRSGLIDSMHKAGIDISLALPLAGQSENVDGINRWAALQNRHPVYLTGTIHPDTENPEAVVRTIAEYGLKGVKVHPEYQEFTFEDGRLDAACRACIEHDLFLITHAGRDINFPPPPKSDPESLARFHRRFPDLKLVLAHFGSWGMWQEIEEHLIGLPVYLDLAFVADFIPDEKLVEMIRRHGADRILFGSDSPWRDQGEYVAFLKRLPLSEAEFELIAWKNAVELLQINL